MYGCKIEIIESEIGKLRIEFLPVCDFFIIFQENS